MDDPKLQRDSLEAQEPDYQRVKTLRVFYTHQNAETRLQAFDAELGDHLKAGWFIESVNETATRGADSSFFNRTILLRRYYSAPETDSIPF